jgi:hypothetical protein
VRRVHLAAAVAWLIVGTLAVGVVVAPVVRLAMAPGTPSCDEPSNLTIQRLPEGEPYRAIVNDRGIVWSGTVHPGVVAQTGLTLLAVGNESAAQEMLDLLHSQAVEVDGYRLLPYGFDFETGPFQMKAPWYSAMDQGQALSLAVRLDDRKRVAWLLPPLLGDSPVARDTGTGLWLEEYPYNPPNPVLNGAIYASYGLYDEWAATGDTKVYDALVSALEAIRADLQAFRSPGRMPWYDRDQKLPVSFDYIRVYDEQMATLAAMTGDACFAEMRAALAWDVN